MYNRMKALAGIAAAVLTLAAVSTAIPQTRGGTGPENREAGGQTGGGGPLEGTVTGIQEHILSLEAFGGGKQQVTLTDRTSVVRNREISREQLAAGEQVVVLGPQGDGKTIDAMIVIVGAQMPGGGAAGSGPDGRRGTMQGSGGQAPRGPRAGSGGSRGPVAGAVVSLSPLTIQDVSGAEIAVHTGERTRFVRETSAFVADIRTGDRVRVMPSFQRGGTVREARKVILLPETDQGGPGHTVR
jgi:hypothetical protein